MTAGPLLSLLYVSSATAPFSHPELEDLLRVSRANNARAGVTGMLLYRGGNFMQVIEGERDAVEELYRRIEADPRHHTTTVLLRETIPERRFSGWSMGFRDLDGAMDDVPGYSPFLNTTLAREEYERDPSRAQKLLLHFKRTM